MSHSSANRRGDYRRLVDHRPQDRRRQHDRSHGSDRRSRRHSSSEQIERETIRIRHGLRRQVNSSTHQIIIIII